MLRLAHKKNQSFVFPGRKLGFTIDLGKLHNVSLGQGQETVAELAMEEAAKEGHWVILQVQLHTFSYVRMGRI